MQLLTAYLMSIPGVPCFYYGDEYAAVGGNDPDNRKMMRFDGLNEEESQTRQHATDWSHLRTSRMSLLYGDTEYEVITRDVLRIKRSYLGEVTEIWINKGTASVPFTASGEVLLGTTDNGLLPGWSAVALGR